MFKKIDISKFGLFDDFRWSKSVDESFFNRVNILYGRNYSGKTTLSRIFGSVQNGSLPTKYSDGQFSLIDNDGHCISNSDLTTDYKVRVYNTDFIKENLSWLHDDENGEIKPFTLLGSGNITAQKRIDEINKQVGSVEEKKGLYFDKEEKVKEVELARKTKAQKEAYIERALKDKANQKIKTNKCFIKQGDNYNVNNIKQEIALVLNATDEYLLDDIQKEKHKRIVDEVVKAPIKGVDVFKPKLDSVIEDTQALIQKRITVTNTIKDLLEDNIVQAWVEQGLEHHKDKRGACAFCGSAILDERWKQLDEHFSKESEELKLAIKKKISSIEVSNSNISRYLEKQEFLKEKFYSAFHERFDELVKQWNTVVEAYCAIGDKLIEKLEKRQSDIFKPKEFIKEELLFLSKCDDVSEEIFTVLEQMKSLIDDNKSKTDTISDDKNASRKVLRFSEIKSFLEDFEYVRKNKELLGLDKILKSKKDEHVALKKKVEILEDEKKQKELELNDEGEAANKVNNHLSNFFGHDGLKLKPETVDGDEPHTQFVIMRGDGRAYNLSEGECSLISFCYYMAKMEDELKATDTGNLIIYIDDPISSLDNNHIFFMYSLIETVIAKNKGYGQLFISTHNLDFLKYVKRLTVPRDAKNNLLVSHFVIEKLKRDNQVKSKIKLMPRHLRDYVTEYNYLFKEIYNIAKTVNGGVVSKTRCIENTFTQFYNLPNNMRKFLECYLFYRYPNTDDPIKHLSRLFDGHVPAYVNRVVNEHSHLSWGERGALVTDVPEAESVAKDILKAIRENDLEHFNALCDSVGVDKGIEL